MSNVRSEMMAVNGRPAMVKVAVHPNGRIVPLALDFYLDEEISPELREKLARLYAATQKPEPPVDYRPRGPRTGIGLSIFAFVALLGLVMAFRSQPLSGGVFFGALLAAVGVAGVFRILHVTTGRNR